MRSNIKRLVLACSILGCLLGTGCLQVSRKTRIPADQRLLPAQTKSRDELLRDLEARSGAVSSLTAAVLLDVSSGQNKSDVLTEYRQTKGILQVDRPKQVRIRIQAPVVATTVVDMVSDGAQFRVWIPVNNKFYVGDATAPPSSKNTLTNLRPQHILDALFVDVRPYINDPSVATFLEEAVGGKTRYYVMQFVHSSGKESRLLEKIWIDRTNLQVTRKEIFTGDGQVQTDVQYLKYTPVGGIQIPLIIAIERPIEDYNLQLTFKPDSLKLNDKMQADTFQLERPAGSELVQADNPGPRP